MVHGSNLKGVRYAVRSQRAGALLYTAGLSLSVVDAGCGIHAGAEGGIGMVGMRERLAAVGGMLRVESAPGAGARIEAVVPLPE